MNGVRPVAVAEICLLRLEGVSVYQQLQIEEALLRADLRNWCVIQAGVPAAIVMGISGDRSQLVDEEQRQRHHLPIIRRFSGGGTVVVDEHTCLVSLIFNTHAIASAPLPPAIMQWSAHFYRPLFADLDFQLRESDYVLGDRKCGGNAQYICRDRWLHHTSFLWDYTEERMQALKLPQRAPQYRQRRDHSAFLCRLREQLPIYPHATAWLDTFSQHLQQYFQVIPMTLAQVAPILQQPHRQSVRWEHAEFS